MSTPIETNTEELQEVLQQVYNLPNRSGGSTTPDLVIPVDFKSFETIEETDIGEVDSSAVIATQNKLSNGEAVNVLIKGKFIIDSGDSVTTCIYPLQVHTRNQWFTVDFITPTTANGVTVLCEIAFADGEVAYATARSINTTYI
jgi:hypothetical protein